MSVSLIVVRLLSPFTEKTAIAADSPGAFTLTILVLTALTAPEPTVDAERQRLGVAAPDVGASALPVARVPRTWGVRPGGELLRSQLDVRRSLPRGTWVLMVLVKHLGGGGCKFSIRVLNLVPVPGPGTRVRTAVHCPLSFPMPHGAWGYGCGSKSTHTVVQQLLASTSRCRYVRT